MTQEPTPADIPKRIARQFIFIAFATAPAYMALALVRFTDFPVVGWVLYVVSGVACAILVARATGSLGADQHPALRQNALTTILMCTAVPIISILAILYLPE